VSDSLLVVIAGLGLPGLLPALAVARRSPALVFVAPLIGAGLAAIAAGLELAVGGSLLPWYAGVAITVNVATLIFWLVARRSARLQALKGTGPAAGSSLTWSMLTVVVVLGAMVAPLTGLRAGITGYDTTAIWLTHALMVAGGHHVLLSGLQNPVYLSSNPDYPPLVPAAGALAFALAGQGHLHVAVGVTVLLSACALGVGGVGVAAIGIGGRPVTRVVALAAGAAQCLAGFAVAGIYGIDGHADLLWSAAAAAAIVWGLVLPQSTQALGLAWVCAAVAGLTKNEGLTTALVVLVLIAIRYRPLTLPRLRRTGLRASQGSLSMLAWPGLRLWAERAAFVAVPALPGLAWAGLARHIGLHDAFFRSRSTQSVPYRAAATMSSMAAHLTIAPLAIAVLVAGCCLVRHDRDGGRLGNPAWLWAAGLLATAILFATYVFGSPEIHWWLHTSVLRTTIFPQLLLYTDVAAWLVIAFGALTGPVPIPPGGAWHVTDAAPVTARAGG
jgi:hypothetical protein